MAQPSNLYTQYFLVCDVKCWLFLSQHLHHLASKVTDTIECRIKSWLYNTHAFCNHKLLFLPDAMLKSVMRPTRVHIVCATCEKKKGCFIVTNAVAAIRGWGGLLPSCLMLRSLWNSGVSMIFTSSGWRTKCPWMGSWNNCVDMIKAYQCIYAS